MTAVHHHGTQGALFPFLGEARSISVGPITSANKFHAAHDFGKKHGLHIKEVFSRIIRPWDCPSVSSAPVETVWAREVQGKKTHWLEADLSDLGPDIQLWHIRELITGQKDNLAQYPHKNHAAHGVVDIQFYFNEKDGLILNAEMQEDVKLALGDRIFSAMPFRS